MFIYLFIFFIIFSFFLNKNLFLICFFLFSLIFFLKFVYIYIFFYFIYFCWSPFRQKRLQLESFSPKRLQLGVVFSQNDSKSFWRGYARHENSVSRAPPHHFVQKVSNIFYFFFSLIKWAHWALPHTATRLFSLFFLFLLSPLLAWTQRYEKREFERGWDWEIEIEREESLREGETEKERSRVREFERKGWELGETPPVGAERRSGELVTQRPDFL